MELYWAEIRLKLSGTLSVKRTEFRDMELYSAEIGQVIFGDIIGNLWSVYICGQQIATGWYSFFPNFLFNSKLGYTEWSSLQCHAMPCDAMFDVDANEMWCDVMWCAFYLILGPVSQHQYQEEDEVLAYPFDILCPDHQQLQTQPEMGSHNKSHP